MSTCLRTFVLVLLFDCRSKQWLQACQEEDRGCSAVMSPGSRADWLTAAFPIGLSPDPDRPDPDRPDPDRPPFPRSITEADSVCQVLCENLFVFILANVLQSANRCAIIVSAIANAHSLFVLASLLQTHRPEPDGCSPTGLFLDNCTQKRHKKPHPSGLAG